ncbi:hypothetical protein Tco_0687332 [Tanacetum coccineum]
MGNVKKSVAERTRHKRQYDRRINERQMQSRESKDVSSKALDASFIVDRMQWTKNSKKNLIDPMIWRHNPHLQEARKKTQERNRNSKPSVMPSVRLQNTVNGHRFSPKKTSAVYEKTSPRSCLRWKPTGKIFTIVGLKWIPTGKFIQRQAQCKLNSSLNLSAGPEPQLMTPGTINSGLVQNIPSPTPVVPPTKNDWDSLFQPISPSSTTVDQDASLRRSSRHKTLSDNNPTIIPQVLKKTYDIEVAHMDNDPYFGIPSSEPSSKKTTLQGVIPSNLHHLSQWFDTLTKFNTEYQLAGIFTKALGRERIEFLINKLGMRSFMPETLKQLADEAEE